MRKLISLLAATALAVSGVAAPAAGAIGQACDEGLYSDTWLCATVTVPSTVTLSPTERVPVDIVVDYAASGAFELDTNNWIRITSQTTGVVWVFDLDPISSTRDGITLTLAPGLATGRYTIDPNLRITRDRGAWVHRKGVWMMPTYHPSALLRTRVEAIITREVAR